MMYIEKNSKLGPDLRGGGGSSPKSRNFVPGQLGK